MSAGSILLAQEEASETHVYNQFVSKTVNQDNTHKWNLNFLALESTSPKSKNGWSHSTEFGPDRIYIGFAEMANTKGFDIKPGSSWEWGFSLMSFETWNGRENFGFSTCLELTRSSYRIKGNDAFHTDANGWTVCDDALKQGTDPLNYSKQRLIHWSWRVPVMMTFRTSGHMHYSIGAEAELRHHVRSRANVGKQKKYYINRNSLDVEPFGYNALVAFGNDDFEVFGRYNLSDMFGKKSMVDCQPFSIGICFRTNIGEDYSSF